MIGVYSLGNIDLNVYRTDLPELSSGKNLDCITWRNEPLLIRLRLIKDLSRDIAIRKISIKDKNEIKGYCIWLNKTVFENYVRKNKGRLNTDEIMPFIERGVMIGLPFDRLHVVYQDIDGTNATRKFNPNYSNS